MRAADLAHTALLLLDRRTGQRALTCRVLLPLVQVTAENGVLVGETVIDAELGVVGFGERAASQGPVVRSRKCVGVPVVRVWPEPQILLGHVAEPVGGKDAVRERRAFGKRVADRRR